MKAERKIYTVEEICKGFTYNEAEGKGLFGLSGRLTIQPEYQRNYLYAEQAQYYADRLVHEYPEYEARVTILGHLQRGGVPTANDRILASRLGVAAIEALKDGQRNVMIGVKNDQIVYVPFNKAIRIDKPIDRELINVLNVLSI